MLSKDTIGEWMKGLQDRICTELEAADGKAKFREDLWERDGGGGGRTRIMSDGHVIEKGGVNFSAVHGMMPENVSRALNQPQLEFYATGVSIVQHPVSPMVPIIHMNVRYFELENGVYWFGGGIDLTPHYAVEDDAVWFHHQLKNACDAHSLDYYPKFKKWADDYFYIKHRGESRGVGGIFFDRLSDGEGFYKEARFDFVKEIGNVFAPIYTEMISRHRDEAYTEENSKWQRLRRGRYVEFNLVLDKGTKFGLDTNGRTESILMSMPPEAHWDYNADPVLGTPEAYTLDILKQCSDIDWTAADRDIGHIAGLSS